MTSPYQKWRHLTTKSTMHYYVEIICQGAPTEQADNMYSYNSVSLSVFVHIKQIQFFSEKYTH